MPETKVFSLAEFPCTVNWQEPTPVYRFMRYGQPDKKNVLTHEAFYNRGAVPFFGQKNGQQDKQIVAGACYNRGTAVPFFDR